MAYTFREAIKTAYKYLNINEDKVKIIENTNNRGIVYDFDGKETVIFIYPISCKQNNKQNFFDTRDSGAKERGVAWDYANKNGLRYFCFGFNEEQERYKNYILSLESDENSISNISFRKIAGSESTGTQVNIPNDFIPSGNFTRICTPKGFYISAISKEHISEYIRIFDNRPYMLETLEDNESEDDPSIAFETKYQSDFPRNRILFGAPGTGKSFTINSEKDELVTSMDNYERVTFHPDYSYANFVGTYKPIPTIDSDGNDAITYEYVPGPFMRVYVNALKNGRTDNVKPFLLIIEEINRANVAAVFGDIFQLLDRDGNNVSEYPIQASEDIKKYLADELGVDPSEVSKIRIPDNMFIWATMNSADQGVFPMDTAFKRRWDFTYLGIDDRDKELHGKYVYLAEDASQKIEWNKLRKAINNFLAKEKINEDKQLGPYFLSKCIVVPKNGNEIDRVNFIAAFKNKVLMYLFEDAAKQKRERLFKGCKSHNRYSEICKEFDAKGVKIFDQDIINECEV